MVEKILFNECSYEMYAMILNMSFAFDAGLEIRLTAYGSSGNSEEQSLSFIEDFRTDRLSLANS